MILVIDIDGVIAITPEPFREGIYEQCKPVRGAAKSTRKLTKKGHTIILHTARHEGDRRVTKNWLFDNGFTYDKLVMGKPLGDVYIDDKALRFRNWFQTLRVLLRREYERNKKRRSAILRGNGQFGCMGNLK